MSPVIDFSGVERDAYDRGYANGWLDAVQKAHRDALVLDEQAIERAALEMANRDREEDDGLSPVATLGALSSVRAGWYRSRARAVLAAALRNEQEDG